ncbi:MAG TPA: glycosyltransferase family 4 protein [Thermomicrobiaceae bacterium]|nr:glycosyltransferase family 4 protein [Thermomicrobiaceae bacterium]
MRVTLVVSSLACGGSERVLSTIANFFAQPCQGWRVTLLTFDAGEEPFYRLHPAVEHHALDIQRLSGARPRGTHRNLRYLWKLRRALRRSRPEVILSFVDRTNVATLLASRGLGAPVVISERVNPRDWLIGGPGWRSLRRLLYPQAAALVVQTRAVLAQYPGWLRTIARVIPNPVVPREGAEHAPLDRPEGKTLIAAGRLVSQKGFDVLLRAFARVARCHPGWRLVIWGDGPERAALEALRHRLDLDGRACLPGVTPLLGRELRRADLFALSSRFEGFPNVLCEALACGLPAIACDCPDGPRELIRDGINGLLVPRDDVPALAGALERLMDDPGLRCRLAAETGEARERFALERVMGLWRETLVGAACSHGHACPAGE